MNSLKSANIYLDFSAKSVFAVTLIGQMIFVVYILARYYLPLFAGNPADWNGDLPHGYEEGNSAGNITLGFHLVFAAIISFIGPIQLIPQVRNKALKLHRWMGRIYVLAAVTLSLSGLYLEFSGRKLVGDSFQHAAIAVNAVLILVAAAVAVYYAMNRKYALHRRWAIRMFWAVSGVWLFRVGLMSWIMIHQKPVGFDMETFSGPFLTILAFSVYILPVLIVEIYLRAKDAKSRAPKYLGGSLLYVLTPLMLIGVAGATIALWVPHIIR